MSLFDWFVVIFVGAFILDVLGYFVVARFFNIRFLRKLYCKMGWHSIGYDYQSFDGCSAHAKCKWCGYEGLVDSQGNLF